MTKPNKTKNIFKKKKINKQSHNIQTYILIKTYLSIVSTNNPLDFFFLFCNQLKMSYNSYDNGEQYDAFFDAGHSEHVEQTAAQKQSHYNMTRRTQMEAVLRNQIATNPQDLTTGRHRYQTNIPPPIFVTPDGRSMRFTIQHGEPRRAEFVQKIITHGGAVIEPGKDVILLGQQDAILLGQHGVFSIDFIDDCIEQGQIIAIAPYINCNTEEEPNLIDPRIAAISQQSNLSDDPNSQIPELTAAQLQQLEPQQQESVHEPLFQPQPLHHHYEPAIEAEFPPSRQQQSLPLTPPPQQNQQHEIQPQQQQQNEMPVQEQELVSTASSSVQKSTTKTAKKSTNRFTEEQDEFILERIRENPRLRNSHKFYDTLATMEILNNHTQNSIRSRYRRLLQHRLYYVYKIDDFDRLVYDKHGEKIKVGIEDIGGTLKNKFTAEDDYILCKALKDAKRVVYSVFSDLYRKNPHHSINSWRDRYRKFVGDGDIEAYITYYEKKISVGETPEGLSRVVAITKPKKNLSKEVDAEEESRESV